MLVTLEGQEDGNSLSHASSKKKEKKMNIGVQKKTRESENGNKRENIRRGYSVGNRIRN